MTDVKSEPDFQIRYEPMGELNGCARAAVSIYRKSDGKLIHDDTFNRRSSLMRGRFARAGAEKLGNRDLAATIDALVIESVQEEKQQQEAKAAGPKVPTAETLLANTPEDVKQEALAKLRDPDVYNEIGTDLRAMGVAGSGKVARGGYVVGVSRMLDDPRAAIARGASSSGKSFEIATVGRLFPPEAKLEAHHLSAKSLYYLPDGALEHRFVIAGERNRRQDDDQADATKALREMISDGVLRAAVTETIDGRLTTTQFEKRGPIAFIESTSASNIFGEDLNRCIILDTDESADQTKNIITAAAKSAANGATADVADVLVPIHHAMQRMLKPYRVVIPFAPILAEAFPVQRVEARRAMPHLLGTIKAVALLRQYQKQPRGDGVIDADAEDYAIALDIMVPTLARLTGAVDQQVRRVWEAIQSNAKGEQFTRLDAAAWAGIRESDAGGRLRVLAENNYLIETQEHRGNKPAKFKVNEAAPVEEPGTSTAGLPTADEVAEMLYGEGSAK